MAGLNRLKPNPPYSCLTMAIAKNVPITVTHQGAKGGILIANSKAVNAAKANWGKTRKQQIPRERWKSERIGKNKKHGREQVHGTEKTAKGKGRRFYARESTG